MFSIVWTNRAGEQYRRLKNQSDKARQSRQKRKRKKSSKQEGLFKQVMKTIRLLLENPKHPSLHTHEYDSLEHPYDSKKKVWEAYAQNRTPGAFRVFWCYGPKKKQITIIALTPHP